MLGAPDRPNSCLNSPSVNVPRVRAKIFTTATFSVSAMKRAARANSQSPARTVAPADQRELTVGMPRRVGALSTRSS